MEDVENNGAKMEHRELSSLAILGFRSSTPYEKITAMILHILYTMFSSIYLLNPFDA